VVVNDFNAEAAQKVVDEIKRGVLARSSGDEQNDDGTSCRGRQRCYEYVLCD